VSELRSRPAWRALEKRYEGAEVLERLRITPERVVPAALESLERSHERIVASPA
jgi:hypothetical protein